MSGNPELDSAMAKKALETLCGTLVPLGLPFIIVIGLPNEGQKSSGTARAGCGLSEAQNRRFLMTHLIKYMNDWESGKLKPNRKLGDS